jgi:hypothetical protein
MLSCPVCCGICDDATVFFKTRCDPDGYSSRNYLDFSDGAAGGQRRKGGANEVEGQECITPLDREGVHFWEAMIPCFRLTPFFILNSLT